MARAMRFGISGWGRGDPATWRASAREAEAIGYDVLLADFGPEQLHRQVAHVRAEAGDRAADLELQALVQHVEITGDRRAACERLASAFGVGAEVLLTSPYVCIGTVNQIVEQLLAQRERFGLSYYVVFGAAGKAFAPVIERLHSSSSPTSPAR